MCVFMCLCGGFGAWGRSASFLRSEGLMAPLSLNWQVKSLKASQILFDKICNETVEKLLLLFAQTWQNI